MSYTLNRVTLWGEESTYETDVERIEREHEAELAAAPCDEVEVGA
jgi:hypothetical protein